MEQSLLLLSFYPFFLLLPAVLLIGPYCCWLNERLSLTAWPTGLYCFKDAEGFSPESDLSALKIPIPALLFTPLICLFVCFLLWTIFQMSLLDTRELGFVLCFSLSTVFLSIDEYLLMILTHWYWYDRCIWYLFCHHFVVFSFYFIILFCVDLQIFWKINFLYANLLYIQYFTSLDLLSLSSEKY